MSDPSRALVITGASSGIGAALARAAARGGYGVTIVARRAERLEALAQEIRAAGGRVATLASDVTARDVPARIVEATLSAFGRIDAIVNNAGRGAYGLLLEQSDAAIEAQWHLHVAAPLRLARLALPQLEATRGQLVFVGSGIARVPLVRYGAYAIAKAGVRAAAIQLRRELRERGVGVIYVDPGLVATEFHPAMGIQRANQIPPASPERVARAILRGIAKRRAVVNGVWWQTFGTTLGEWFGTLTDPIVISRLAPSPLPSVTPGPAIEPVPSEPIPSAVEEPSPSTDALLTFDSALEPLARRMERVKLSAQFLRDALVPGTTIELNALAMRWAGMPNKNERAALHEALMALEAAGFLEPLGGERWRVLRGPE